VKNYAFSGFMAASLAPIITLASVLWGAENVGHNKSIDEKIASADSVKEIKVLEQEKKSTVWPRVATGIGMMGLVWAGYCWGKDSGKKR
jgi:hypothetical protein